MPTVTTDEATLRYRIDGDGDETVVFVPEATVGPWLWSWQAPALAGAYRTLVYATRGTDESSASGPYEIGAFVDDLERVLAAADVRRAHLVGAGLGGVVALEYVREYERARSLTLLGVAATGERVDEAALNALCPSDPTRFRESLSMAFTDRFLAETALVDRIVEWRRNEDATGEAHTGQLAALRSFELGSLYEVTLPTLVFHGVDDPVIPVDAGKSVATDLPRGRFEAVEGKRFCFVEHSRAVTDVIDEFVDESV